MHFAAFLHRNGHIRFFRETTLKLTQKKSLRLKIDIPSVLNAGSSERYIVFKFQCSHRQLEEFYQKYPFSVTIQMTLGKIVRFPQ